MAATIDDLLKAMTKMEARLEARLESLEKGQADIRKDVGVLKRGQVALAKKVDAHRKETKAGFEEINEHFDGHITTVHRDLEDDIIAIHKGLVRANVPGIPKDLPSEVRAKGEQPSKPTRKKRAR